MRRPRCLPAFGGLALAALMALTPTGCAAAQESALTLFGAGSLREADDRGHRGFTRVAGLPVATAFGFSGLMRERIEAGEHADVFASADMGHAQTLLREGRAVQVVLFTRNTQAKRPRSGTSYIFTEI